MKVLITGVHGLIAGAIYKRFVGRDDMEVLALARRRVSSERVAEGEFLEIPDDRFFLADLTDYDALRRAFEGVDVVVQMAADPRPDTSWENILNSNMIGAYNVFESAREAGVKRIVYASSIMTDWGYWQDEPYKSLYDGRFECDPLPLITVHDPPRPTEPYSASKVWGEALARTYSDVHGMSCLCVRIGWVNKEDDAQGSPIAPVWCSQRDIVSIVEHCVDAPEDVRFDIFYGISRNRYRWADIDRAKEIIGWAPEDGAGW